MTTALQCFTTHACDHIDYKPPRAPPTHKLTIQHARRPPLMFKRKKKLTAHRRAVRRSEGIATPLGGFTPSADTSLRFYCLLKYLLTTGSLHSVPYSSDSLIPSFNTLTVMPIGTLDATRRPRSMVRNACHLSCQRTQRTEPSTPTPSSGWEVSWIPHPSQPTPTRTHQLELSRGFRVYSTTSRY